MKKIDTSKWRSFVIGDLFEKLDLRFLPNRKFNKASDTSIVKTPEFNLPLVNAKHGNNGIMYYGREEDFDSAENTICIVQNGAIATGDVYPEPQKTGVLWDAYLIKPIKETTSPFVLAFLSTVLEKSIKDKFSYANKCVWDKVSLLTVKLPVTTDGEPDWGYMDSYMKSILEQSECYIKELSQI